ncbi:transposase [Couchioplanes caeruleus]|uniref:Transposase IS701-like DDE domain-containing protein n=1 Tax=Couchioplanes caeruleus subsp. caeruleus TaxID=56427 RepID=A0A1K0FKI7_9ACTN|nr:transposase [Couchioplanes caeruleus]OJF13365.1 hypothetical protein BG844_15700 [Couchioplanes caeruleus subsp. caeruleus]
MLVVAVMTDRAQAIEVLAGFREEFYRCMNRRADALFELTEALLCTDGPVKMLVGLSLAPEHRRGHGALYDAFNHGHIDVESLRRQLAGLPLPRAADGRLVLAVDVSPWLRPDGACSPQRLFCHTYGRGKDEHRMIPGWPYSIVAALESDGTSWAAVKVHVGGARRRARLSISVDGSMPVTDPAGPTARAVRRVR